VIEKWRLIFLVIQNSQLNRLQVSDGGTKSADIFFIRFWSLQETAVTTDNLGCVKVWCMELVMQPVDFSEQANKPTW